MTFPLIVVLADREGSNWVLATLPFIRGLLPHSIQWETGNVDFTYKLFGYLRYSHSSLPNWAWVYLHPTSFIGRILPSSRLIYVRHDVGSNLGMPIPIWCDESDESDIKVLKNTIPAGPCENISSPHPSTRSYPDAENLNELTILLSSQVRWRI